MTDNQNNIEEQGKILDAAQALAIALGREVFLKSKSGIKLGTIYANGELYETNTWDLFPSTPVFSIGVQE